MVKEILIKDLKVKVFNNQGITSEEMFHDIMDDKLMEVTVILNGKYVYDGTTATISTDIETETAIIEGCTQIVKLPGNRIMHKKTD